MKNKNVIGLLIVMSLIVASISASALNSPYWKLNDKRGESYKQYTDSRYALYHIDDVNCPKGMLMGRYSDGSFKCSWAGSNKNKDKQGGVNDESNTPTQQEDDESGDDDTCSGNCEEDDEGGCEGDDNDCKETEVCETVEYEVKEKVWKETCEYKKGKLHCNHGWVWQDVIKSKEVCHVEVVCEELEE